MRKYQLLIFVLVFMAMESWIFPVNPSQNKVVAHTTYQPTQKKREEPPKMVLEGGFYFPTEALSGIAAQSGWGLGYGGGVGILFDKEGNQFRLDISKYYWSISGQEHWRFPFFVGWRVFPTDRIPYFMPFLEIGFEVSVDRRSDTESDIHYGGTPGVGFEVRYLDFVLGFSFRYHIIKDSYFSFRPYLGVRL